MADDKGRRRVTPKLDPKELDKIANAVARQLPGWHLAKKQTSSSTDSIRSVATARGATLDELRRKFLPADEAADAVHIPAADAAGQPEVRITVLVEQDDGGPQKVADIVGGEVKLVQG